MDCPRGGKPSGASVLTLAVYVVSVGLSSTPTPSDTVSGTKPAGDTTSLPISDPTVLTVSKKPEDGGKFSTINKALERSTSEKKVIRVLDDAVYEEADSN